MRRLADYLGAEPRGQRIREIDSRGLLVDWLHSPITGELYHRRVV